MILSEISYAEYLANPKYRKFPFKGLIGWILQKDGVPSVEDLQNKYAFTYYSTMNKAVTDVNNGTTANGDSTKDSAVTGVYTDENGGKNVVLLKDHTEATRVQPSVDMTINLGGHKLSANNAVCINVLGGNLTIDGRLRGSSIEVNLASSGAGVQIPQNATVGSLNIIDTRVIVATKNGNAFGVYCNNSNFAIKCSNCDIRAYSNYEYTDAEYTQHSRGIYVRYGRAATVNNCYAMGTHSGMTSNGTLYVNGGTFEGYGHGGIYFSGTGTTAYVRDAILRDCDMPDGYTSTHTRNGAGGYLGSDTKLKVYMDNCDIYGISASQIFVIKTTDNALYISNSTINNSNGGDANVRIDSGNTLYLGVGNNFTAEDTNNPEAVIVTDEVYVQGVA